jgi:hypothetical protein
VIDELMETQGKDMLRSLLTLERDRLQWLLKSYLRARLGKVERYAGGAHPTPPPPLSNGA